MKILIVTYCFGSWKGQSFIGVYKRGLRIGMELSERGHEVSFFCTARREYEDDLTRAAEKRLHFVDFRFTLESGAEAQRVRSHFLEEMTKIRPDIVLAGEAPLAGAMLEASLCAVELGIPLVVLDNAYRPEAVEDFCRRHGPIADGVILCGPTSFHSPNAPAFVRQVPAFVHLTADSDESRIRAELGLRSDRVVAVLAYDAKVEQLAFSLLEHLDDDDAEAVFLTSDPSRCNERAAALPDDVRTRIHVLSIPSDPVLFGIIKLARLAVCKYGFMQVSECLSLRTPVIAVFHEGNEWLQILPETCAPLAHRTDKAAADSETISKARRFLSLTPHDVRELHRGGYEAAREAAEFIEGLPRSPRYEPWKEGLRLGFTESVITAALSKFVGSREIDLFALRAMLLRECDGYELYSLVCGVRCREGKRWVRLWGRRYEGSWKACSDRWEFMKESERRVLYFSARNRMLIEADWGEAALPSL